MNINGVQQALSRPRLIPYLKLSKSKSLEEALGHYHKNVQMAESLYPLLHVFEITLRNNFETVLIEKYGEEWFFADTLLVLLEKVKQRGGLERVTDALQLKSKKIRRPITSGWVVTEMSFSFWTSLLGNKLEGHFWGYHSSLFPFQTKYKHSAGERSALEKYVNESLFRIRNLRNRVFHHESIIFMDDLDSIYSSILEILKWMSQEVWVWVEQVGMNRFTQMMSNRGVES